MTEAERYIQNRLFTLQDTAYGDFQRRLMPAVDREKIIGVRTPDVRKLARELGGTRMAEEFMKTLPHTYYEENNLHGCLIEGIKDYAACMTELERFLPFVDNWATCDMMTPKILKKHLPELLVSVRRWIVSEKTYTVRYGIRMLMAFYLDEAFDPIYPALAASVPLQDYYVNMMIAWYFATALAKQWDAVIPYLEKKKLDPWVHNKTIQKACESLRITSEQKLYLKTLKN